MAFRINEWLNGTGKVGHGGDKGGDALPVNLVPSFLHLNPPLFQLHQFTMPFLLLLLTAPKSSCQHWCTAHYARTKVPNFPAFRFRAITVIILTLLRPCWWFWSLYNQTNRITKFVITSLQGNSLHEMIKGTKLSYVRNKDYKEQLSLRNEHEIKNDTFIKSINKNVSTALNIECEEGVDEYLICMSLVMRWDWSMHWLRGNWETLFLFF